uniref:Uncharacterized protein n=1 Tax=Cannabis sativa TaxID=3483 RepID=A0A803PD42_CANSA
MAIVYLKKAIDDCTPLSLPIGISPSLLPPSPPTSPHDLRLSIASSSQSPVPFIPSVTPPISHHFVITHISPSSGHSLLVPVPESSLALSQP